jgi:hypothetical protein
MAILKRAATRRGGAKPGDVDLGGLTGADKTAIGAGVAVNPGCMCVSVLADGSGYDFFGVRTV